MAKPIFSSGRAFPPGKLNDEVNPESQPRQPSVPVGFSIQMRPKNGIKVGSAKTHKFKEDVISSK